MYPDVVAWALAKAAGSRAQVLATALTGDTTRVTFDGRTVDYRSSGDLGRALAGLYGAENATARRPTTTFSSFSRSSA